MNCKDCKHWGDKPYLWTNYGYPGTPGVATTHRQCMAIVEPQCTEPPVGPFFRSGSYAEDEGEFWTPPEFTCSLAAPKSA